ncbi:MAG: ATP-dependent DNA helicase RecG, partial [Stappiaceae bacterium]
MRPTVLDPLFAPVESLEGIGPKSAERIAGLVGGNSERAARVVDLLFHLPASIIDRRNRPGIAFGQEGAIVTLEVSIDRHMPVPPRSRAPYRVSAHDDTGEITFVFFHARRDWLEKTMPQGEKRFVSGKIEWFNGRPQMVHPDLIATEEEFATQPLIEPIYPMTAGLAGKTLRKGVEAALARLPDLPEWLDGPFCARENFPAFYAALKSLHHPVETSDIAPDGPPHRRLAYDEYLASQVALAMVRQHMRKRGGISRIASGNLKQKIIDALPFSLTDGQTKALADIEEDLAAPERMLRLVQGDVGSGKTIVALLAMAHAVEAGGQAALMAPTEILARQHYASIAPLCEAAGLRAAVVTGRDKARVRREIETALADGEIDILIGTHALFQAATSFKNLALAVVDEQHRFGVHQRLALSDKGRNADVLVMTATPIPRTLVLTFFGDMDVSQLTEKPAGRQPIQTNSVSLDRLGEVVGRIKSATENGQKAYWICPLVEESEVLDVAAAEDRYQTLKQVLGDQVALVHGRMSGEEKEQAMQDFKSGTARVLVATTVIEVGVDVPDAAIIVIEHSERFGLAQLHQLRGRVGRGSQASHCLLLYKAPLSETAKSRLNVMRETNDGFRIAEEDLKLRGEGEILGTRQSGLPGFRMADMEHHADLMEIARDDARLILEMDPDLTSDRGQSLRL